MDGTLRIDLKGTEVVVEEPEGWFNKLLTKLTGKTEYEKESVTQLQYLEKIYIVFTQLGWNNIVSLDINGETVYDDDDYEDEDFKEAINLAYSRISEKDFEVTIHLENTTDEKEDNLTVAFASKHEVGEFPLVIEAELDKSSEEVTTFLTEVKAKINNVFGIESGEIEVEEDDSEDEESEDDTEDEEEESAGEESAGEVKESEPSKSEEEKSEEIPVTA